MNLPVPRIQACPAIKLALNPFNKRHEVPISLRFQTSPSGIPQATPREARYHRPAIDTELVGMRGKLVDPVNYIVHVTAHSAKIERDKKFEVGAQCRGSGVGRSDLGALPRVSTHVQGEGVAASGSKKCTVFMTSPRTRLSPGFVEYHRPSQIVCMDTCIA